MEENPPQEPEVLEYDYDFEWFYLENGERVGPISDDELCSRLADGRLAPTTPVWKEGMPDWMPAIDVDDLYHDADPVPQERYNPNPGFDDPRKTPLPPVGNPQRPFE